MREHSFMPAVLQKRVKAFLPEPRPAELEKQLETQDYSRHLHDYEAEAVPLWPSAWQGLCSMAVDAKCTAIVFRQFSANERSESVESRLARLGRVVRSTHVAACHDHDWGAELRGGGIRVGCARQTQERRVHVRETVRGSGERPAQNQLSEQDLTACRDDSEVLWAARRALVPPRMNTSMYDEAKVRRRRKRHVERVGPEVWPDGRGAGEPGDQPVG